MTKLEHPRNSCMWKPGGTTTFRLASTKILSKALEFGNGSNMQNPSSNILLLHKADKGKILIQPDQAGAEALVVSRLCKPGGNYRKIFDNGIKPHVYTALHIFKDYWAKSNEYVDTLTKTEIEDLTKHFAWKDLSKQIKNHDTYYFIGKKTGHSYNYRMKPSTFQLDVLKESEGKIVLTKKEAELFEKSYFNLFPEIKDWHTYLDIMIENDRVLYNLQGFPRDIYDEPITDKTKRDFTAFIPQSTVGTITNIAFWAVQQFIEENNLAKWWDCLNNKHDSIMIQCPEEDKDIACELTKASMAQDLISPYGETFTMKSEVSIGKNWGKYHPRINPEGMREI